MWIGNSECLGTCNAMCIHQVELLQLKMKVGQQILERSLKDAETYTVQLAQQVSRFVTVCGCIPYRASLYRYMEEALSKESVSWSDCTVKILLFQLNYPKKCWRKVLCDLLMNIMHQQKFPFPQLHHTYYLKMKCVPIDPLYVYRESCISWQWKWTERVLQVCPRRV